MELCELHRVVEVRVLEPYRLGLTFEEGTYKEVDIETWLQDRPLGVFEPLLDPLFFAQVKVDPVLGTIVWPNGADLCPDVLFAHPETVEVETVEAENDTHLERV